MLDGAMMLVEPLGGSWGAREMDSRASWGFHDRRE